MRLAMSLGAGDVMTSRLIVIGTNSQTSPTVFQDMFGTVWPFPSLTGHAGFYSGTKPDCVRGAFRAVHRRSADEQTQPNQLTLKGAVAIPQKTPGADWSEIVVLGLFALFAGFGMAWIFP